MGFFSRKNKSSVSAANLGLRIVLEHSATPLYELRTGEYSREIVIGRGSDSTWSLNGVDGSASTRHAMISRRKDNFYITDLGSRNGIFFQNKRIKERKLESGDKITLGECVITVENVTESIKKVSQFNRLVYVSEKGRRVTIDITKPQMIIGSAPDCDIIFQDQLVSSQHAEINQRSDGSCWLKDLGSRNGTSVNGAELLPDGERMLQDNDVITIAYWDINFWDATVQHQNSKIWPAIIAVAITTVVVLTGFVIYSKLTPDAPSLIEIATKEMQAGRYDSAKKILLDSVPYAEGAQEIQVQREQLLWRIEQWEKVIKMWDSVQNDLRNKFFSRAIQKLSTISDGDLNSWTWPGGAQEKQKANAIKRLLDACSMSSSGMKNVLTSVSDIDRIRRELIVAMTEAAKYEDDYFVATVN
ncbi:MAG: FHA domain-containing protein, partial [Victivallaceae bacterium]